jgi:putative ABC transport system permease protein
MSLTRLMSSLLFGVKPADALTFISVIGLLFLVAMAASYIPARRAAGVDPLVALRTNERRLKSTGNGDVR